MLAQAPAPGFAGRTALVTGASSGIGRAIAQSLGEKGASLHLPGRRVAILEEIAARGGRAYRVDLGAAAEIEAFAAEFARGRAGLDLLIHSAGVIGAGAIDEVPAAELDRQWNINLRAPYLLTQKLLPLLKAAQGQVVFINSSAGARAVAGAAAYSAAKHGLRAFADSLRAEINPAGVRVLDVFVGKTATPMQAALHARAGRPYRPATLIQAEDVAAVVVHALGLPRTVEVTAVHLRPLRQPD